MIDLLHLNLSNTILPLAVLSLLTFAIPAILAGATLSQARLAAVMALTLVAVWATGAGLMAALYASVNDGQYGTAGQAVERSGLLGLFWGPLLALVWLMRAQGIERRKGLMMGRGGDEAAD